MHSRLTVLASLCLGVLLACGAPKEETPFFQMRGVVLAWDDIIHPETLDWMKMMKETGMNTISICGKDYLSEEYAQMKQKWIDAGFDFEYEEHAMSFLLPRDLFATHPEYFRMDENGERKPDGNGCPSCQEGLQVMMGNVEAFAKTHMPTNHRYYTWLFDGGDICHCPQCKDYSASDQGLIFENHIIKALRAFDPKAQLAHLAYHTTTPAPTKVKPEEGIFLEFAPFYRSWSEPLSKRDAIRPGLPFGWTHGDYMDMLKANIEVFGAENAQVLEYWMDVSLVSDWKKPQKQLTFHNDVFQDDLKTYASLGIRNITCYGVYIDDYYTKTFGEPTFVYDYGRGLRDFRAE